MVPGVRTLYCDLEEPLAERALRSTTSPCSGALKILPVRPEAHPDSAQSRKCCAFLAKRDHEMGCFVPSSTHGFTLLWPIWHRLLNDFNSVTSVEQNPRALAPVTVGLAQGGPRPSTAAGRRHVVGLRWLGANRLTICGNAIGVTMPEGYSADAVAAEPIDGLDRIPVQLRKSITFDQGAGWAKWCEIADGRDIDLWFYKPYRPRQRSCDRRRWARWTRALSGRSDGVSLEMTV